METMYVAGRRSLPPVPRPATDRAPADRAVVTAAATHRGPAVELVSDEPSTVESDAEQQFVARLRSAAADFATAAGAESAVVREAVPPARHRRSRCRVVLRYADDLEADVTFLGPAGEPDSPSRHGFDRQIRRWLGAGARPDDSWLVADPDAREGVAVDVTAWATRS